MVHSARGQTVVRPVPGSRAELGGYHESFRRLIRYGTSTVSADWDRFAVFAALGLGNGTTVQIDGLAWHRGVTEDFPDRDYFDFTFGAGIRYDARLGSTRIGLSAYYHQLSNVDQSSSRFSKRNRQFTIAAPVSRQISLPRARFELWMAPAIVLDRLHHFPTSEPTVHGTSVGDLGIALGANATARERAHIFGQLAFVNFWSGAAGVSITP
jgi:hypothetical protein